MRVGVDTGGTFTDVVAADGRVIKVLATRDDPGKAVREGVRRLGTVTTLAHGTTVATNAVLERRGADVVLVTNEGCADLIEIARQDRPSLYDIDADRPAPLVPAERRFEVPGRLDASGAVVDRIEPGLVPVLPYQSPVAVCLLHADLNPTHELAVASQLERRGHQVTCSHEVSPEMREYERTVTTVIDAFVKPTVGGYLTNLAGVAPELLVMSSAGGLLPLEDAATRPSSLLLSGPAGGVRAAADAAMAAGFADVVTFDMGGTSTDVCLVLGGAPEPAAERDVGGFPVRKPSLDIHTIGAGGGSIAWVDDGGALRVGPRSAGADPGPACYGRGGKHATVTDADLVAGRIPVDAAFPGLDRLDVDAARRALDLAGVGAHGVIDVVDAAMVQAVRAVTVSRGIDPRRLALVAFGGAGPLHACAVAGALGIGAVVVPPRAGVLSAVGMLTAPRQVDLVRSWADPLEHHGLSAARAHLSVAAAASVIGLAEPAVPPGFTINGATGRASVQLSGHGAIDVETTMDCRYAGQSHELMVPSLAAFEDEHRRRNGYARRGTPVEVVAIRARAVVPSPVTASHLPAPRTPRHPATGPAVLSEPDCTVWVPDGWHAEVHDGTWVLSR